MNHAQLNCDLGKTSVKAAAVGLKVTLNILHFLKCSHIPALGSAVPGLLQWPPCAAELQGTARAI